MIEFSIAEAAAKGRRKMEEASFLRQPGRSAEPEVKDEDKKRFVEPLAQLMMDCGVGRKGKAATSDEEVFSLLVREAMRVVEATEIPTLHKAVTAAKEVRKYLESRAVETGMHTELGEIEPTALKEFIEQSYDQVRAVEAMSWLRSNLRLSWPIDKVDKLSNYGASLTNNECKRATAAQPSMIRDLEEAMVVGAESGHPFWLALLASWLQAMANLSLDQVLHNSVPAELFSDWILFRWLGKDRGLRKGFYWGVPAETAGGYNWTTKFLEAYNQRRQSDAGKAMMDMIFRTDTFEFIHRKEVCATSRDAVAGGLGDPEMVTSSIWRELLPTMAVHLKFSAKERTAVVMRADVPQRYIKVAGDEVPVTSGYAEKKEGKSRTCKLICAAVFSSLASKNIRTFDEVSSQQWEELAIAATTKVMSKPMEVDVVWRNPDMEELGGCLKMKKSQVVVPGPIAGYHLALRSRDGRRYCGDFQHGSCRGGEECQLGSHRCAIVLRRRGICHGDHPGSECKIVKRRAVFEEEDPQGKPARKKVKAEVRAEQPVREPGARGACKAEFTADSSQLVYKKGTSRGPADPAELNTPEHVEDYSIMRRWLYQRRGDFLSPELPRLVAKVCKEEGRGELWLGPFPKAQRMDIIKETKPSIQIYCLAQSLMDTQAEPGGEWEMLIPRTRLLRFEMVNPHRRRADLRALRACVIHSLRQGDNAYVHGTSGTSEAPMAAALLSAMLMKISFEAAQSIISRTRNVNRGKKERRMQDPWIDIALGGGVPKGVIPWGFARQFRHDKVVVHAMTVIDGGMEPICCCKEGDKRRHGRKRTRAGQRCGRHSITVGSVEKAVNQFGGRFCGDCESRLRASLRIQVERFFGQAEC